MLRDFAKRKIIEKGKKNHPSNLEREEGGKKGQVERGSRVDVKEGWRLYS